MRECWERDWIVLRIAFVGTHTHTCTRANAKKRLKSTRFHFIDVAWELLCMRALYARVRTHARTHRHSYIMF